ncbi:hypothetical protein JYU19_01460 [bacterium AH-315-J21]|nr:hypothetical protein [bacterium AH-315-J21]
MNNFRKSLQGKQYIAFGALMYLQYFGMRRDLTNLPDVLSFVYKPISHDLWLFALVFTGTLAMVVYAMNLNWSDWSRYMEFKGTTGRSFLPILYAIIAIILSEVVIWMVSLMT